MFKTRRTLNFEQSESTWCYLRAQPPDSQSAHSQKTQSRHCHAMRAKKNLSLARLNQTIMVWGGPQPRPRPRNKSKNLSIWVSRFHLHVMTIVCYVCAED